MKNLRGGIKIEKASKPIPVTCPGIEVASKIFVYQGQTYRLGKAVQKKEGDYIQRNLFLNYDPEDETVIHNGFDLITIGKRITGTYVFIPEGSEYAVLEETGEGVSNQLIVFSGWLNYAIWKLLNWLGIF